MQSSADGPQNPFVSALLRVFGSGEPPHIHVKRENTVAKVWVDPVALERAGGFSRVELNAILELVQEHRERSLRSGYEFFGR
jgi:hypothetical protein